MCSMLDIQGALDTLDGGTIFKSGWNDSEQSDCSDNQGSQSEIGSLREIKPHNNYRTLNSSKYKEFSKRNIEDEVQAYDDNDENIQLPNLSPIELTSPLSEVVKTETPSPQEKEMTDGFVLKKIIDFDKLREIREKTLNRSNTFFSSSSQQSRLNPQLNLLIDSDRKASGMHSPNSSSTRLLQSTRSPAQTQSSRNIQT